MSSCLLKEDLALFLMEGRCLIYPGAQAFVGTRMGVSILASRPIIGRKTSIYNEEI